MPQRKAIKRAAAAMKKLTPAAIMRSRSTRQIVASFAERIGLVYFGFVDQRSDEHTLIRGYTLSNSHRDYHYCIGSYRDYDVSFVLRSDRVRLAGAREAKDHTWLILRVDLRRGEDIPHMFIAHDSTKNLFASKYMSLIPISLSMFGQLKKEFTDRFTVFSHPAQVMQIERVVSSSVTDVIAQHFGNTSIEIADNTIYLQVPTNTPTKALLERTLSNGVWLAETLDALSLPITPFEV